MKGSLQLLSLAVTVGGVVYCNHAVPRPLRRLQPRQVGPALLGVALLLLLAWAVNAPKLLQVTHPEVVAAKAANRALCSEALASSALLDAETAIRNNTVSVKLSSDFNKQARQNLDRSLRRVNHMLFFNIGVYMSVVPLMFMVGLAVASTWPQLNSLRLDRFVSQSNPLIQVAMPAINAVTAIAVVAYVGFYFWLEEAQVTGCCLHSGHWYTYSLTTMACAAVLAHLVGSGSLLGETASAPRWYAGWCAAYQALAWRVLKTSQQFFHDDLESRQGMLSALMLVPVILGTGYLAACDAGLMSKNAPSSTDAAKPNVASKVTDAKPSESGTTPTTQKASAPKAAPLPPPPPPAAAPTPPPPPPPATQKQPPVKASIPAKAEPSRRGSIDDMFDQIKHGQFKLKPVSPKQPDVPTPSEAQEAKSKLNSSGAATSGATSGATDSPSGGDTGFLRNVIEQRREFLRQDSVKSDGDWDDDA